MAKPSVSTKQKSKNEQFARLRKWNLWLSGVFAAQGVLILLLSTTRLFPVQTSYTALDPIASEIVGHPVFGFATRHLFDIQLAYVVGAMFFLAALAHLVVATIYRNSYEAGLKSGINKARWVEYALTSALMFIAIGLMAGITDLSILVLVFALAVAMNLSRLAIEMYGQRTKLGCAPYVVSYLVDIVIWVVIGIALWSTEVFGAVNIAPYVYWAAGTAFLLFAGFAANLYLQHRRTGKWKEYIYGEHIYMALSLAVKTALAWQIFAGVLRP